MKPNKNVLVQDPVLVSTLANFLDNLGFEEAKHPQTSLISKSGDSTTKGFPPLKEAQGMTRKNLPLQ